MNQDKKSNTNPLPEQGPAYSERFGNYFGFTLSIPERSARALSALVGGSTELLTKTVIPKSLNQSASYRFTVGMFQSFLIDKMAGMQNTGADADLGENFVPRKLLGTTVEAAGLLTMRLSPVWVFAIASDAAQGSRVFLNRLVKQLKENGVIAQESNPDGLEDVLEAIQDMGRHSATAFDTPPMNRDEIRTLVAEMREKTGLVIKGSSNLIPDFEVIWEKIKRVSIQEKLSTEEVMGILSVQATNAVEKSVGTATAIGQTGIVLLEETILSDYRNTLDELLEYGAIEYVQNHMTPFIENAKSHFDINKPTWTQKWLTGLWPRKKQGDD